MLDFSGREQRESVRGPYNFDTTHLTTTGTGGIIYTTNTSNESALNSTTYNAASVLTEL